MQPDFSLESLCAAPVAGVDEAGRGPWAGPVVAGAVIFIEPPRLHGLNDSKKLSPAKRETLFIAIREIAEVGVGIASVEEIDQLNILNATKLAMQRAIAALPSAPATALVDGNQLPKFPCPAQAIVKGDGKSLSIAASSIIAKVTRDKIMRELAAKHPMYGWEKNAGYGTALHHSALKEHGVTIHHRRSFAPVRALLEEEFRVQSSEFSKVSE